MTPLRQRPAPTGWTVDGWRAPVHLQGSRIEVKQVPSLP
jgi:hypothetical protein